jgi:hypothetical protein
MGQLMWVRMLPDYSTEDAKMEVGVLQSRNKDPKGRYQRV